MFNKFRNRRLMDEAGKEDQGKGAGGPGNEGGKNTPSDAEAKLLKEVMDKKTRIRELEESLTEHQKKFEGIDPEAVKQLLKDKAESDRLEAERQRTEAEKRGEFESVKTQMIDEHNKALEALTNETSTKLTSMSAELEASRAQIIELTIGRSFGDSSFVRDQLTLTPAKARTVYGGHFEVKDGNVVGYDKPVGAAGRSVLVDGNGSPLQFEKALEKIVNGDPDRDHMLRSQMRAGSGSKNQDGAKADVDVGSGRDRIRAAVNAGAIKLPSSGF
ncbi:DUF6651 domain-containing protein [Dyella telluris]|uniref:DUF6651 domain-containing protein n=1 Tax=Dyella telluris TaxID=2763498 RepID=A0A7G8Q4G5_9GAMM|nr:DUF6651 domain-containing protein [Dyella telluris]QNK01673.1 hypothetical protein H8F01_00385 [Dyella telluris]